MIIWLDGTLVDSAEARIDPMDRAFLLGDGVFETILLKDGKPEFLQGHIDRLMTACRFFKLVLPEMDWRDSIVRLVTANGIQDGLAALRVTVSRGSGARGLLPPDDARPLVVMTVAPYRRPESPAHLVVSPIRRNETSPAARFKTVNYMDNMLALQGAREEGADEAILLNTKGVIACCTYSTLFLIEGESLVTPRLEDGALPGIMRAEVLKQARSKRYEVREESLTEARLQSAHAAFLTNSLMGVRTVSMLSGRPQDQSELVNSIQASMA